MYIIYTFDNFKFYNNIYRRIVYLAKDVLRGGSYVRDIEEAIKFYDEEFAKFYVAIYGYDNIHYIQNIDEHLKELEEIRKIEDNISEVNNSLYSAYSSEFTVCDDYGSVDDEHLIHGRRSSSIKLDSIDKKYITLQDALENGKIKQAGNQFHTIL